MSPSDLERSIDSLQHWLVAFTIIVAIGLVIEYAKDLGSFFVSVWKWIVCRQQVPVLSRVIIGGLLITIGVIGEGWIELRSSSAETELRSQTNNEFSKLGDVAGKAEKDSSQAADAAARANMSAELAKQSAGDAEGLARGARKEADTFEHDIMTAKEQAASAESHLADALKKAADATAELNRLKSPRSLSNVSALAAKLAPFKGMEYTFSEVFADEESINLLRSIDDALQTAGWKRGKPVGGFPAIEVFGSDNFSVRSSLGTGVKVSIKSQRTLTEIQAMGTGQIPTYLRAAIELNMGLQSSLNPPEEGSPNKNVNLEKGDGETIYISVGKKP